MAYKIGPLEHEFTMRHFQAERNITHDAAQNDKEKVAYWQGVAEAYTEAAREAERLAT